MKQRPLQSEQSNCRDSSRPSSTAIHRSKASGSHQPMKAGVPVLGPGLELTLPGTASGAVEPVLGPGTEAGGLAEAPGKAVGSTWAAPGQPGSTALEEEAAASSSTAGEVAAAPSAAAPLLGAEPFHHPSASLSS